MGIKREFRTICWTPDGRHIRSRPVKNSESIGENDICLDICKWWSILIFSHKAEKPLDLPCSTLTNLTLVGVKEPITLLATFLFFKKGFQSVQMRILREKPFLFSLYSRMIFFRKYLAWLEDRCLPVAIVVVYAIKAEILMFFSQQTYVNLSQYDNRLYANGDDLIEEEQDEVKSRSATQF